MRRPSRRQLHLAFPRQAYGERCKGETCISVVKRRFGAAVTARLLAPSQADPAAPHDLQPVSRGSIGVVVASTAPSILEGCRMSFSTEQVNISKKLTPSARPHAVEMDEPDDPPHIGALGVNGVVVETEHLSHVIEASGLLTSCDVRHIRSPSWNPVIADNRHRAKLPKNPTNIALSGQNGRLINGWAASMKVLLRLRG